MGKYKKPLAYILLVAMLLSLLPFEAMATEENSMDMSNNQTFSSEPLDETETLIESVESSSITPRTTQSYSNFDKTGILTLEPEIIQKILVESADREKLKDNHANEYFFKDVINNFEINSGSIWGWCIDQGLPAPKQEENDSIVVGKLSKVQVAQSDGTIELEDFDTSFDGKLKNAAVHVAKLILIEADKTNPDQNKINLYLTTLRALVGQEDSSINASTIRYFISNKKDKSVLTKEEKYKLFGSREVFDELTKEKFKELTGFSIGRVNGSQGYLKSPDDSIPEAAEDEYISVIWTKDGELSIQRTSSTKTPRLLPPEQPGLHFGEFEFKKVDEKHPEKLLSGAVCTLKGSTTDNKKISLEASSSEGVVKFSGLPDGNYQLKEKTAPQGYSKNNSTWKVTVEKGVVSTDLDRDADDQLFIPNPKYEDRAPGENFGSLKIYKKDDQRQPLSGAIFTLKSEKDGSITRLGDGQSLSEFLFDNLEPGHYILKEEQAPKGYKKTDKQWNVYVAPSGATFVSEKQDNVEPEIVTGKNISNNLTGTLKLESPQILEISDADKNFIKIIGNLMVETANPGDYFDVHISDTIHYNMLQPDKPNQPPIIDANTREVIAVPRLIESSLGGAKTIRYTFTNYVLSHQKIGVAFELNYSVDMYGARNNGEYDFRANIGNTVNVEKKIKVSYPKVTGTKNFNMDTSFDYANDHNGFYTQLVYINPLGGNISDATKLTIRPIKENNGQDYSQSWITANISPQDTNIKIYEFNTGASIPNAVIFDENLLHDVTDQFADKISIEDGKAVVDFGVNIGTKRYLVLVESNMKYPMGDIAGTFLVHNITLSNPSNGSINKGLGIATTSSSGLGNGSAYISNPAEMEVMNTPVKKGQFVLYKTDDDGRPLGKAQFSLLRTTPFDPTPIVRTSDPTTGKIIFDNLEPGTYKLGETSAPDQYIKSKAFWYVNVDTEGNTVIQESNPESAPADTGLFEKVRNLFKPSSNNGTLLKTDVKLENPPVIESNGFRLNQTIQGTDNPSVYKVSSTVEKTVDDLEMVIVFEQTPDQTWRYGNNQFYKDRITEIIHSVSAKNPRAKFSVIGVNDKMYKYVNRQTATDAISTLSTTPFTQSKMTRIGMPSAFNEANAIFTQSTARQKALIHISGSSFYTSYDTRDKLVPNSSTALNSMKSQGVKLNQFIEVNPTNSTYYKDALKADYPWKPYFDNISTVYNTSTLNVNGLPGELAKIDPSVYKEKLASVANQYNRDMKLQLSSNDQFTITNPSHNLKLDGTLETLAPFKDKLTFTYDVNIKDFSQNINQLPINKMANVSFMNTVSHFPIPKMSIPTLSIEVRKGWKDTLETEKTPVTVELKANSESGKVVDLAALGVQQTTKNLSHINNWTYVFTGLPQFTSNGERIRYRVEETSVSDQKADFSVEYFYSGYSAEIVNSKVPEITVSNKKMSAKIEIKKTDGTRPLKGAIFSITKVGDSTFSREGVSAETTGLITFDNLLPGDYIIEETSPPPGFKKTDEKWKFRVAADGSVKRIVESTTEGGISTDPGVFQKNSGGLLNMASKIIEVNPDTKTFTQLVYMNNWRTNTVYFNQHFFQPMMKITVPNNNESDFEYEAYSVPRTMVDGDLRTFDIDLTKYANVTSRVSAFYDSSNHTFSLKPSNALMWYGDAVVFKITGKYEGSTINTRNTFECRDSNLQPSNISTTNSVNIVEGGKGERLENFVPPLEVKNDMIPPPVQEEGKGEFKIDKLSNGNFIGGAVFDLYEGSYHSLTEDTPAIDLKAKGITRIESSPGKILFKNIPPGIYTLKETTPPKNHKKTNRTWTVIVYENGYTKLIENPSNNFLSGSALANGVNVNKRLTISNYQFKTFPQGGNEAYLDGTLVEPNKNGRMQISFDAEVTDGKPINPGDYFTVKLDNKVDHHGILPETPPLKILGKKNEVLAIGSLDSSDTTHKTIKFVFTDFVAGLNSLKFTAASNLYVDRFAVKDAQYINIQNQIAGQNQQTKNVYIDYGNYESLNYSNIGGMITSVDEVNGTFTYYVYANPMGRSIPNAILNLYDFWPNKNHGTNSNAAFGVNDIKIYKVGFGNVNKSYGVEENQYTDVTQYYIAQNRIGGPVNYQHDGHSYAINFQSDMYDGSKFIIKVTGKISSVGDSLYTFSKLESGYYNDNGQYVGIDSCGWENSIELNRVIGHGSGNIDVDTPLIKVANLKNASFDFKKVDMNGRGLAGATFELRGLVLNAQGDDYEEIVLTATSNKELNDLGTVSFGSLPVGKYELYEKTAPPGYKRIESKLADVVVDEDDISKIAVIPAHESFKKLKDGTYQMINTKAEVDIEFQKIDGRTKDDSKTPLEAEFKLYKEELSPSGTMEYRPVKKKDTSGVVTQEDYVVISDGATGKFKFEKLPDGKYAVKETRAPEGYLKPDGYIVRFTIQDGAIINMTYKDQNLLGTSIFGQAGHKNAENINYVYNYKATYPSTGGIGSLPFVGLGLVLMGISIMLYRKRKEEYIEGGGAVL